MKNLLKKFLTFLLIFIVLAGIFSLFSGDAGKLAGKKTDSISISDLVQDINNGTVISIKVQDTKLTIKLTDGQEKTSLKGTEDSLPQLLNDLNVV